MRRGLARAGRVRVPAAPDRLAVPRSFLPGGEPGRGAAMTAAFRCLSGQKMTKTETFRLKRSLR